MKSAFKLRTAFDPLGKNSRFEVTSNNHICQGRAPSEAVAFGGISCFAVRKIQIEERKINISSCLFSQLPRYRGTISYWNNDRSIFSMQGISGHFHMSCQHSSFPTLNPSSPSGEFSFNCRTVAKSRRLLSFYISVEFCLMSQSRETTIPLRGRRWVES